MKNIATMLLLCIAFTVTAQRDHHKRHDLSPEQHATLQTKKMTLALVLDESQSNQVYQILFDQAQKRKALRDERKSKDGSERTKEDRFAHENKILDAKIAMQNKMKTILSEEQFKLWRKMNHKRHEERRHHRNSSRR